jgi:hypothetical protein
MTTIYTSKAMATPSTLASATQKALSLPEILSGIFHWIYADEGRLEEIPDRPHHYTFVTTRRNRLHSCALTSRLWFAEAIALLWKVPSRPDLEYLECNIEARLGPLHPSRREFYAKFIEEETIETRRDFDRFKSQLPCIKICEEDNIIMK